MCGAIANRRSIRAASSALPSGRAVRLGIQLRGSHGPTDAEPGIAALPQASSGSSARSPGRPCLGEVGRDLRVVGGDPGPDATSASAGSARSENGIARPMTVTASPGASRASR